MRFGAVPTAEAAGAILAHSLTAGGVKYKKGRVLGRAEAEALAEAGIAEVTVARLEPGDVPEDTAAGRVAAALAPDPEGRGLTVSAPFTGRCNLYAAGAGVLRVDAGRVAALNAIDEAVTLATLPDLTRVAARQMVATVKIIPYAAPDRAVVEAERTLAAGAAAALRLAPPVLGSAGLVCTAVPGMKQSVIDKGADAVRDRVAALGLTLAGATTVAHETAAIARAIAETPGDLVLVLTGSATSDRADCGPAAVEAAGGRIERFGMPVDPGNLLFLGRLGGRRVVGLPGCARSPKLNGVDWVLERLVSGIPVGPEEIAAMGVGGLLKEIPSRPAPRAGGAEAPARRPVVAVLLLAAGAGTRMRGADKLLEDVGGEALLARLARGLRASGADEVLAVLPEDGAAPARADALAGTGARTVANPRAREGMGTSIAAGVAALAPGTDAAIVLPADMPEIDAAAIDRLIAAYDPGEGRAIVRATAEDGRPGHPVLFGRRFFESLRGLSGDAGARAILEEHRDFLVEVPLPGQAAVTDLDTPEDWTAWRAATKR